jgi:hypothetical protein
MSRFIDDESWTWTLIRIAIVAGPVLVATVVLLSIM